MENCSKNAILQTIEVNLTIEINLTIVEKYTLKCHLYNCILQTDLLMVHKVITV